MENQKTESTTASREYAGPYQNKHGEPTLSRPFYATPYLTRNDEDGNAAPRTAVNPVMQDWTFHISMMQQTVLMSALRGPDGLPKYNPAKFLLRWLRRCVLYSAVDGKVMTNPHIKGGGSFTGPSYDWQFLVQYDENEPVWEDRMAPIIDEYIAGLDAIPHHFQLHFMHAAEIIGYHHPDERIRSWWEYVYKRLVNDMHLFPETKEQLDARLDDTVGGWRARADGATLD